MKICHAFIILMHFLGGLVVLSLLTFAQNQPANEAEKNAPETHGIVVANMDRSVKPGDNFYEYCNGDWLKRTEIPPDRPSVNVFTRLSDLSNQRTAALIEEIAHGNAAAGS